MKSKKKLFEEREREEKKIKLKGKWLGRKPNMIHMDPRHPGPAARTKINSAITIVSFFETSIHNIFG